MSEAFAQRQAEYQDEEKRHRQQDHQGARVPDEQPQVYGQSSLLADAPRLTRPLLFIHGLADDNVVVAHTLRMSSALLAAGRPHSVLPLSGVTHMTPQEEVAENLLLLQVGFLREALGVDSSRTVNRSRTA